LPAQLSRVVPYGIFRGTLLKEMRVLHDIEAFDHPGQRMWPHLAIAALGDFELAEDEQRLELGEPPICGVAELVVNLSQASCPFNLAEPESRATKFFSSFMVVSATSAVVSQTTWVTAPVSRFHS
jgi:hypothetical protein